MILRAKAKVLTHAAIRLTTCHAILLIRVVVYSEEDIGQISGLKNRL